MEPSQYPSTLTVDELETMSGKLYIEDILGQKTNCLAPRCNKQIKSELFHRFCPQHCACFVNKRSEWDPSNCNSCQVALGFAIIKANQDNVDSITTFRLMLDKHRKKLVRARNDGDRKGPNLKEPSYIRDIFMKGTVKQIADFNFETLLGTFDAREISDRSVAAADNASQTLSEISSECNISVRSARSVRSILDNPKPSTSSSGQANMETMKNLVMSISQNLSQQMENISNRQERMESNMIFLQGKNCPSLPGLDEDQVSEFSGFIPPTSGIMPDSSGFKTPATPLLPRKRVRSHSPTKKVKIPKSKPSMEQSATEGGVEEEDMTFLIDGVTVSVEEFKDYLFKKACKEQFQKNLGIAPETDYTVAEIHGTPKDKSSVIIPLPKRNESRASVLKSFDTIIPATPQSIDDVPLASYSSLPNQSFPINPDLPIIPGINPILSRSNITTIPSGIENPCVQDLPVTTSTKSSISSLPGNSDPVFVSAPVHKVSIPPTNISSFTTVPSTSYVTSAVPAINSSSSSCQKDKDPSNSPGFTGVVCYDTKENPFIDEEDLSLPKSPKQQEVVRSAISISDIRSHGGEWFLINKSISLSFNPDESLDVLFFDNKYQIQGRAIKLFFENGIPTHFMLRVDEFAPRKSFEDQEDKIHLLNAITSMSPLFVMLDKSDINIGKEFRKFPFVGINTKNFITECPLDQTLGWLKDMVFNYEANPSFESKGFPDAVLVWAGQKDKVLPIFGEEISKTSLAMELNVPISNNNKLPAKLINEEYKKRTLLAHVLGAYYSTGATGIAIAEFSAANSSNDIVVLNSTALSHCNVLLTHHITEWLKAKLDIRRWVLPQDLSENTLELMCSNPFSRTVFCPVAVQKVRDRLLLVNKPIESILNASVMSSPVSVPQRNIARAQAIRAKYARYVRNKRSNSDQIKSFSSFSTSKTRGRAANRYGANKSRGRGRGFPSTNKGVPSQSFQGSRAGPSRTSHRGGKRRFENRDQSVRKNI